MVLTQCRKITYRSDGAVWCEYYYHHGGLHRASGPAVIGYRRDGTVRHEYYYLHGESVESL